MQTDFTAFQNWLTCQYPHSSARKHYLSDLALFFSWIDKPPAEISPQNIDRYIHHCLEKTLSPLTINRRLSPLRLFYYFFRIIQEEVLDCPVVKRHFLRAISISRTLHYRLIMIARSKRRWRVYMNLQEWNNSNFGYVNHHLYCKLKIKVERGLLFILNRLKCAIRLPAVRDIIIRSLC